MGDLAFPASVMFLKFFCKLFVDQRIGWLDAGKAILAFPVDIVFLSLSFGSAILYTIPSSQIKDGATLKSIFVIIITCVIIAILTILLCKKSDAALTQNRPIITAVLFLISYAISLCAVFGAISVKVFLQ